MSKLKKILKNNYKLILGIILGLIWSMGIAYAATILFSSEEVSYDNTTSGLSATNVQSALDELYIESTSYQLFETRVTKLESLYSVGSIYISTTISSKDDVEDMFGGTWEAISQGRVLIGAGTGTDGLGNSMTFSAGSTGGESTAGNSSSTQTITNPLGEYTHKLVTNEMPSHKHNTNFYWRMGDVNTRLWPVLGTAHNGGSDGTKDFTSNSAGSDYYHNNIQPYLVVYMYKRTA